jgi:uncharacterized phosphosugar-binding protein
MLELFQNKIFEILDTFRRTQEPVLKQVASAVADRMAQGGILYVVGSGHSHMVGEEFYARAGGLACIRLIAPMELTLGEHPMKSTIVERSGEYAQVILTQYKITDRDIVMIVSNSGRNALPVELALELKRRGIPTVAFTGLNHSRGSSSRHASGKRLFEICDYVIDNCGCPGDASMELEGVAGKMGSTSSIVGMFMAQSLSMLLARELADRNMEVPVFLSSNLDEGDRWNKHIMEKYYGI